jgi:lipid-binding SYLF domain-containing protein
MRRIIVSSLLAVLLSGVAAVPRARATTQADLQEEVDRATLAAEDILGDNQGAEARKLLPNAKAVMVCPRIFKGGFMFGGEIGSCVLLARGAQGSWSFPAFYGVGGGSFGAQIGIQDAEIMMVIMTDNGLRAVMDSQFRLGAGASVALVTLGTGVEGATTAALSADIVAFARPRGLFAGIAIQGSIMNADSEGDEIYYGQPVGTVDIVRAMRVNNPGADPLRAVLMKFGGQTHVPQYAPQEAQEPQEQAADPPPPPPNYTPEGGVQQENLPAPH